MKKTFSKISVIGLGYVGLPLAAAFGKIRDVVGYDINKERIDQLKDYHDKTLELSSEEIKEAVYLKFTSNFNDLASLNCFIVTVPTPINESNDPDLNPLNSATKMIGSVLKEGDIVIYESTVYPGLTEEVCVPILEEESQLILDKDFYVGYSPERINPGDKNHQLADIVKITSGSTEESAEIINQLYSSIISAGTHKASSIKVAEAAKVIENTQRDVNIALINELAKIFNIMGIDTDEVLTAAQTKWNFLPFKPGLVGGHCIGVDPYYLTYKSQMLDYNPEIILAGRKINDGMSDYIANKSIEILSEKGNVEPNKVLILGLTFKENCPDLRNSKVFDIIDILNKNDLIVDVFDPWVEQSLNKSSSNFKLISNLSSDYYNAIIIAVAHDEFFNMGIDKIRSLGKKDCFLYDLKSMFNSDETNLRL
ncbi:MAG: nucleotide sugar dehydrogenase [Gammaproteobacteria bacterium]